MNKSPDQKSVNLSIDLKFAPMRSKIGALKHKKAREVDPRAFYEKHLFFRWSTLNYVNFKCFVVDFNGN